MLTGRTLAHYRVLERTGRGGMGEVYVAEDTRLGRKVALKVLLPEDASDPERLARFRAEARSVAALNHPNIVTIHSVEDAEGTAFLTMELVDGRTLDELIPPGGMDPHRWFELALPLVDAVAAAHDAGIVHRDLKPRNVMVAATGRLKVLDFGLAKMRVRAAASAAETAALAPVTREGFITGTVPYMSPEQVRGLAVDPRSDVFSLGTVLYEMAAGRRPFEGRSEAELISAILRDPPPAISDLRAGFPAAYESVLGRALQKDPAARPVSARELLEALRDAERAPEDTPAVPARQANSVAVLDFANLARDPAVDWLSTGIAETVTADLKKVEALSVVGRDQVARAAGGAGTGEAALAETGARLGVRWMVGGAFQKFGDRIRITAHFLDVPAGELAGSVKIDGGMDDIFALQDRVISGLMENIRVELTDTDIRKIERPETPRLEAYEYYARGRRASALMGEKAYEEAESWFHKALAVDPGYAAVYSSLGEIYAMRFIAHTRPEDLEISLGHLRTAVRLDPDLADPYVWLAYGYARLARFDEAIAAGERGVELDLDNGLARYMLAVAFWLQQGTGSGRPGWGEAVLQLKRANELLPLYQPAYQILADVLVKLGRHDEARRRIRKAAEIEESGRGEKVLFVGAVTMLGALELREGRLAEASETLERALTVMRNVDHVYAPQFRAITHAYLGEIAVRENRLVDALRDGRAAEELMNAHPRALGTGRVLVLAKTVAARALAAQGDAPAAARELAEAAALLESRRGAEFSGIWEASDADLWYAVGRAHAAAGNAEAALTALDRAVEWGWEDGPTLRIDPAWDALRGHPEFAARARRLDHAPASS